MAGLAVIIICLTLALIWMWKRMEKMKQEIYTFTDRLEECLDAMASGEEIKNPGNCEDSLWDKVYERLRRIENIWSRREEESVAEKKQIKEPDLRYLPPDQDADSQYKDLSGTIG